MADLLTMLLTFFTVCLITLSVAQYAPRMVGWLLNINLEQMWEEAPATEFEVCMEGQPQLEYPVTGRRVRTWT
jgi:hypothetical protein